MGWRAQVWATASSTFAVLYAPEAQMPDFGAPSKKKGRAREEESARAAAAAEAQSRAQQATSVQAPPALPPLRPLAPGTARSWAGPKLLWQCRQAIRAPLWQCRAPSASEPAARSHRTSRWGGAGVQVYDVDEGGRQVVQVAALVDTGGERPARLHGGPLLGIAFASTITAGAPPAPPPAITGHVRHRCNHPATIRGGSAGAQSRGSDPAAAGGAGSRTGAALQFFSWAGGQRAVGPQLVEPRWLAWDPEVTLCALAYEVTGVHSGLAHILRFHCGETRAGCAELYYFLPTCIDASE